MPKPYYRRGDIRKNGDVFCGYSMRKGIKKTKFVSPESYIETANNDIRTQRAHVGRENSLERRINSYKLKKGCADCGYDKHPKALCFDHIDQSEKSEDVSVYLYDYKKRRQKKYKAPIRKAIFQEIRKCQILCANCHNIKTHVNKDTSPRQPLYTDIKDYLIRNPGKKNSHIYLK